MRNRVLVALVVAVALAGGILIGVTVGDDDDGVDADGRSTSTSAEAGTSTGPPTTTPASSLAVVVTSSGVLGWWDGDRWTAGSVGPASAVPLSGGEEFAVVVAGEPTPTRARGGRPQDPEEFCSSAQLELDPPLQVHSGTGLGAAPVAVHGVADPLPRPVTVLPDPDATYHDWLVDELAERGIDDPDVEVVQALRVDLEGDGVDEVLLVAERLARPEGVLAEPGDYSAVFLRRVEDDRPVVDTLHLEVNESTPDVPSPYLLVARVDAVADLDGDGAMEVVLGQHYYEGSASTVLHRGPDGRLQELLTAGCGV